MKTKDGECFFFTTLEKRGGYIKRATASGYWRNIGAEREIKRGGGGGDDGQVIGKVKKLVFNTGRSPNNQPTNWVIHEYHLVDNDGLGLETDAYVLWRLSNNSGGNINAPFLEQDWDDDESGGRAPVPSPVHDNRINEKIQQESDFGIKNLFDLNELPREFEMDDDPKTVNDDACLPPCVHNEEAHLPFTQYKRKRQIATGETTTPSVSADMLEETEPEPVVTTMVPAVTTMAPTTDSYTELIKNLQKERQQIAAERKRNKLEMTNEEMTISHLFGENNALCMEIEELKKKNSNKKQGS